jgi:large subunit ribosomal protein L12
MEYAYAALLLTESGEELNERNLRAVLDAADCAVSESRVKALVAALEGVDVTSVGPETAGALDETTSDASDDEDANEHDDGDRFSEVTDEASAEPVTDPAGGDTTPEDSGDESG